MCQRGILLKNIGTVPRPTCELSVSLLAWLVWQVVSINGLIERDAWCINFNGDYTSTKPTTLLRPATMHTHFTADTNLPSNELSLTLQPYREPTRKWKYVGLPYTKSCAKAFVHFLCLKAIEDQGDIYRRNFIKSREYKAVKSNLLLFTSLGEKR